MPWSFVSTKPQFHKLPEEVQERIMKSLRNHVVPDTAGLHIDLDTLAHWQANIALLEFWVRHKNLRTPREEKTKKLVEPSPSPANLETLTKAVSAFYGCPCTHSGATKVHEQMNGQTLWEGEVETFDLERAVQGPNKDHPWAKRAFAWWYKDDHDKSQLFSFLEQPPVISPQAAVQIAIAVKDGYETMHGALVQLRLIHGIVSAARARSTPMGEWELNTCKGALAKAKTCAPRDQNRLNLKELERVLDRIEDSAEKDKDLEKILVSIEDLRNQLGDRPPY